MNILWLHDHNEDHKKLNIDLNNFEKSIVNFTDGELCIDFLKNSSEENQTRPSILIVLNRLARQIVPEIHSETTLLSVIIFCTKNDNKIKWINKYNKIRGIYIDPKELIIGLRHLIKISGHVKPFSCQLILLNDQSDNNDMIIKQLYRLDSSLIIFKHIHLCIKYFEQDIDFERPIILIVSNALGRQLVPEIHSNNQIKAVFIYCMNMYEKIRWTKKYDKIKSVTLDIKDLLNDVRNEGLSNSTLPWHLVCLDDHNDEELHDRLYELDPCLLTFDQLNLCEKYLNSFDQTQISSKPILFIAVNRMGREFIPEIHSNNQLYAFYIFVSSLDQRTKWTRKYNKIKHVCTDLNQLIESIRNDAKIFTENQIQNIHVESEILTNTTHSKSIEGSIVQASIEKCIICWLDSNVNENDELYQSWISTMRRMSNSIQIFSDSDEFANYLTDIEYDKIILIISNSFVEDVLPLIEDVSQLYTVYIYTDKSEKNCKNYKKVKGIFHDISDICSAMKEDIDQLDYDTIPMSILQSSHVPRSNQSNQLDASFMYSQLLKEILLKINYDETSITEFAQFCRQQLAGNSRQLSIVDELEKDYHTKSPVQWYTAETFIYPMLNRALRIFDIEVTIKMGFFIRDLHQEIEKLHRKQTNEYYTSSFIVYRGQGMIKRDFEQLCSSQGGVISFNNFLSTSSNRSVSAKFAARGQCIFDSVGILFQMNIDPSISSAPFARIDDVSWWKNEEEILFSMHTIFRIEDIKPLTDSPALFEVNLILTGDNDEELKTLRQHIRREIGADTGFQGLGALMLEIGQYDKALELYETLLRTAQPSKNELAISSVFNQLGAICSRKGEFDQARSYYEKALDIKLRHVSVNDSSLSAIYSNIGSVLRNQNQLTEALDYMQRALQIEQDAPQTDPLKIASYHNNIGLVLTDQNRYNDALVYYEKAFEIQQRSLPPNHPNLATSYNNIGTIYNEMGEYSKAIKYYEKSLEIQQRSLPRNHPDLATSYNNIGTIYNEMDEYSQALFCYQKSLEIIKKSLPENHPDLSTSYNNIGTIYNDMGEHSKAIEYYEKSLRIMQKSLPSNHPSLALAYQNLALAHYRLASYSTALEYGEKAMQISSQIFKSDDPQMISCREMLNKIRTEL